MSVSLRAKQLYPDGLPLRDIGRKIGRSHEAVRQLLISEGVSLRTRGGRNNVGGRPARLIEAAPVADAPAPAPTAASPPPPPPPPRKKNAPGGRPLLPSVTERVRGLERLKPVNPRIVGWSRAYVARGVRLGYLADLFGVDVDELIAAVEVQA